MNLFLHILTTLLAIFWVSQTYGSENTEIIAKTTAEKICKNPILKKTGLKKTNLLRSADDNDISYFVFADNTNKYCIISSDGNKILGYGDNYSDEMPTPLQNILDVYASTSQIQPQLRSAKVRENIPSFMNVVFGHRTPYNKYVPIRDEKPGPTGCVPTALAQILKYYEYPSKLLNDIPEYYHKSNVHSDSIYKLEGQKSEERNYDWNIILNHYNGDTTEALNNEVAKLMIDCGKSVEAKYEQKGTSASSDMFYYSLVHYFGYNSDSLKQISREYYYRDEWLDIIHAELSKKRPIYISATSYENGGHAFICDGYEDGYLHINWGWDGAHDGYFDIDILDYNNKYDSFQNDPQNGYSFFQKIIIGIEPGEGKTIVPLPEPSTSIIRTFIESIDTTIKDTTTINLTGLKKVGYYSDSSILLRINIEDIKIHDRLESYALAIILDEDTLMSEINTDYVNFGIEEMTMQRKFTMSDINKDLNVVVVHSNNFDNTTALNSQDWSICKEIQSNKFKLSDITIFSTELKIDTIVHTSDKRKHKFDIVFSNPTEYEYYDEVYFVIDQYATGLMVNIPAGEKMGKHIEHEIPVSTNYIQGGFGIVSNYMTKQMVFLKDTSSHVFCQLKAEDETLLSLLVYNATDKDYDDKYALLLGEDTISSQQVVINSEDVVKFKFNLPIIKSDSDIISLNYMKYIAYDNEDNQIGSIIPINFCGTVSQEFIDHEKYINVDLKAIDINNTNNIILGVTSSLENASKYEKVKFKSTDDSGTLKGSIKYSDYFKSKNPKYIGLCKEDGTFYAYMELNWSESNSSSLIGSNTRLTVVSSKNGIWIYSDKDIPSISVYSEQGAIVKTINMKSKEAKFVELQRGIYIIDKTKVLVR